MANRPGVGDTKVKTDPFQALIPIKKIHMVLSFDGLFAISISKTSDLYSRGVTTPEEVC
jgi:hypothetical protein